MMFYHQHQEYLLLANAAVDLAFSFYCEHDLIKTSGLFNFAIKVLLKIEEEKVQKIVQTLYASTLINMRNFIFLTTKKLCLPEKYIDISFLKSQDEKNRSRLNLIRQKIQNQFEQISPNDSDKIAHLYQVIFEKMNRFYLSLIEHAQVLLGKKTEGIAHMYMGSLSRMEATPFSDIESCILIKNNRLFKLAKYSAQLVLMEILQLRETVLSSLGIWVLDKSGNQFYLKLYDNYPKERGDPAIEGICFDQNIKGS